VGRAASVLPGGLSGVKHAGRENPICRGYAVCLIGRPALAYEKKPTARVARTCRVRVGAVGCDFGLGRDWRSCLKYRWRRLGAVDQERRTSFHGWIVMSPSRTVVDAPCSSRLRRLSRLSCFVITLCMFLTSSGCAIYTPFQVFRFTADYNTERRCSLQAEVFEHLPPRPVRVRMNRWAYNVGPQPMTAEIPIPSDAPVAPPPAPAIGPGPALVPSVTPEQMPGDDDLLDDARPPAFPPSPPQPRIDLQSDQPAGSRLGPSARANGAVRGASYEVRRATTPTTSAPTGAWLFGS